MDRVLQVKLLFIAIFVAVTTYLFYDELFMVSTETIYSFGDIASLVASVSFGVIISASIYNLSFYFYMKSRQYLYYGLAQLSTLFFLINLDSLFISPFDRIFGLKSISLFCMAGSLVLFFSLLFIYEFIRDYHIKEVNKLIKIILVLSIVDFSFALFFSISFFTPFLFIPVWLVLSEANRHIQKRDLAFNFLLMGWYITISVAVIEHLDFISFFTTPFPFLHISFAIESIFLSLAISYKFKLLEEKQRTQQAILLQQSRLVSMGEMISTIAHQWREPLNLLSILHMSLNRMHQNDIESKELLKEADNQLSYMSNTIDIFRDFYNPSKTKEEFSIKEVSQDALKMLYHSLQLSKIEIIERFREDTTIYGNRNEFEQVIVNILNNAKDAIVERGIVNGYIEISIGRGVLTIRDNGGGVKKEDLDKIFNPYFSTKQDSDGIGLYISKMIIEQELDGRLKVESSRDETTFSIIL